ncbi:MAG: gliding motility-associated lipoprotein GldH [Saprospiraceae bacterium]|jgi:gliding motility-associated lipoprotein GldH
MNHFLKGLTLLSMFFILGCGPDYILEETYEIKGSEWTYADTASFEVNILDSLRIYNLYIDVEHATDFSSQNMYVMIHTTFPSGERLSEKVSLEMANKAGVWYGDCNSEWCHFSVAIQQGAYFNAIGKHTFMIEQFMRVDPLQGIKNISFKIEDTRESRGEK